ncbi:MAG: DUF1501 domain-containing protein, partial [Pirellulaceae bacterium]
MLTMLGSPRRCCDGITRRETLKAGALTALGGLGMPAWLAAAQAGSVRPGKARNVILLYLLGGAATQDMWDLKPEAPLEVRTHFKPIATSASGVEICEHLPRMARWMHKAAIVRTVSHQAGCHNTLPSYTGHEVLVADNRITLDSYPPSMGSVCEYLRQRGNVGGPLAGAQRKARQLPDYVYMPCYLGWGQNIRRAGPYGGFLGKQCDALTTECSPHGPKEGPEPAPGKPQTVLGIPRIVGELQDGITIDRLKSRRGLLAQIDDEVRRLEGSQKLAAFGQQKQQAFDLLTST